MFDLGDSIPITNSLAEVKIQPYYDRFLLLVTIKTPDIEHSVKEPTRICAIDLGIKNFASITNNIGQPNLLFKGKVLCYENHNYEKKMAQIKSQQTKGTTNGFQSTDASNAICRHRANVIDNYMHKVAKRIVEWCLVNQIDTIVIGSNKHWKQEMDIGKYNNQQFADVPFDKFKKIMAYLCEWHHINLILAEESYTSKASFLDNDDIPIYDASFPKTYTFSGKRGTGKNYKFYISKDGTKINADLNGSANILRKSIPTAFVNGIKPDFSNTLIYKHPDLPAYHCSERRVPKTAKS
jgi:putative transposase